jgi:hypothetical protein
MTEQTIETAPEQPPAPVPCAICRSTAHTTGNHNGSTPIKAAGGDELSPNGNHNGSKAEPA